MNKTEIKYISLLAPLFYLYGTIFLWAKNAHMFHLQQFAYSFVVILVVAAILYCLVYVLLRIINTAVPYNKTVQISIALTIGVLVGVVANFSFLKIIFIPYHHYVMFGIIFFIFICIYLKLAKKIFIFFSILLLFSISSLCYNAYKVYNLSQMVTSNLEKVNDDRLDIKFKDKPNIYLFWLESFHGTRTLEKVYQVDITPLITYLDNNDFSICENMYSTSFDTLHSMSDVYSLGTFDANIAPIGNLDTIDVVRYLIGGSIGNNVLKILKYNDYKTNIIINDTYYFNKKGEYLDHCQFLDLFFDSNSLQYKLLPSYYFTKLYKKIISLTEVPKLKKLTLKESVESQINEMQKENSPYFLAWKGGTIHTSPFGDYTYKDKDSWVKSNGYQDYLQRSIDNEIKNIISMILEKDKNALIVMLGDHGSWVYRGLNLNELSTTNITLDDFIDDKFNVFAAVRLPEKYAKFSFKNGDTYINHSNIFIHIFSLLADNPDYLKFQKTPVSNYYGNILVKNGKIVEDTGASSDARYIP